MKIEINGVLGFAISIALTATFLITTGLGVVITFLTVKEWFICKWHDIRNRTWNRKFVFKCLENQKAVEDFLKNK